MTGSVNEIRALVDDWRATHQSVALVPTMGNLHDGHMSLARLARNVADRVVMSIFVNPTQFGPGEDFEDYPRTLEADHAKVAEAGTVDALFVPDDRAVYPFGTEGAVRLVMPPLSRELCGRSRPGHFDGVASVVCRLLNIVRPEALVLGRKDYQQLVLMKQLVADLRWPVRIVSGPTWREADGVAMSSRNRYLSVEQRRRAPALHAALGSVRDALDAGDTDYEALERRAVERLKAEGLEPEYVEVRDAEDLARPAPATPADRLIVLAAAHLGPARLIDNTSV